MSTGFVNYYPSNLNSNELFPPPPPPLPCVKRYTVYTYTVQCVRMGEWGHRRGGGLRQIKHMLQSPFKGQFLKITTFGIAFCQSNLSTLITNTDG
jgi:hypothetical protein